MYKTDIKDSLEECYSKFKMVEGRISGLEDRSIKTFIVKNRKEKKLYYKIESQRPLDTIKHSSIHSIGVL